MQAGPFGPACDVFGEKWPTIPSDKYLNPLVFRVQCFLFKMGIECRLSFA